MTVVIPKTETAETLRAALCNPDNGIKHHAPIAFEDAQDGLETWVCRDCHLPRLEAEATRVGLMIFRGGPLDGKVFATRDLLHNHNATLTKQLAEYRWTQERVTSARTQAVARVWAHNSLPAGAAGGSAQPRKERAMSETTTEAPAFPGSEAQPTEAVASPDVNVIQPDTGEGTEYGAQGVTGEAESYQANESGEQPAAPTPAAPPVNAYTSLNEDGVPLVEDLQGNSLTVNEYRKRLKIKTADFLERVAAAYDGKFTNMNLWRVEHGGGKRKVATVEELGAVVQVLHQEDQAQQAKTGETPAEQPAEQAGDGSPLE
jgi:hypothetical protein